MKDMGSPMAGKMMKSGKKAGPSGSHQGASAKKYLPNKPASSPKKSHKVQST